MTQTLDAAAPVAATPAKARRPKPSRHDGHLRTPGWLYVVLAVGLVLVVMPFVWMVLSSFKPEAEVRAIPPTWWPETVTTENYSQLFTRLDFPRFFFNSAVVAIAVAVRRRRATEEPA